MEEVIGSAPDQVKNHFNRLEAQSQRWADCYILFSQL
jgi:hypothetical protein